MRLTDAQAQRMLAKGEAVNFDNRNSEYVGGADLLVTGVSLKFPRAATIERPHFERFTEHYSSRNEKQSTEELEQAVAEDRASRAQEEALRMQIYHELTLVQRQKWVREIPADEYDRAEREARGRSLFWFADERTPGGVGVDVNPQTLVPLKSIEAEADDHDEEMEAAESVAPDNSTNDAETGSESPKSGQAHKGEIIEISLDSEIEKEFENEEIDVEEAA
jgi:hypothetical protein